MSTEHHHLQIPVEPLFETLTKTLGHMPTVAEVHGLLHAVMADQHCAITAASLSQEDSLVVLSATINTSPESQASAAVFQHGMLVLDLVATAVQKAWDYEKARGRVDAGWLTMTLEDELGELAPRIVKEVLGGLPQAMQGGEAADA